MKIIDFEIGLDKPLFLIAGPCVIESEQLVLDVASELKEITQSLQMPFIFKTSFDKANRSSHLSYRGPGIDKGLKILEKVKQTIKVPILTDVHEDTALDEVVAVADVLQIPAFLCRQSNFVFSVAGCGKPVNIKKGQFLAPWDMKQVVAKAWMTGNKKIMICERGYTFGYNNLIVDMRSLAIMRETTCPIVFDVTHSVQFPGGRGVSSGGQSAMIPVLARSAVAAGISGIFMEVHPNPDKALSDGSISWPLSMVQPLLKTLQIIDKIIKKSFLIEKNAIIKNFEDFVD
ncbi:3-deoxy-8-phosphooctulonate synthase [Coxiella endosymbiont of Amblyomma americanum]|uniref:3-deoxy-8-phosphooctulonate synthase n=1 Tax=Coxiella endosymbiont of Amblyomma americanum TaxID=325775 RepID=UPI00057D671F|nr:3-deoxy-8-phosphooctulonate synthase [Coxiella endosymbiont of Amblyomma americanum]AJC50223.1 2-dehydro-3-deoxyphosphooctonate aldolase [Coxiella endosymbiont of Amblyomma americanum]AUJ58585.1 3-deoxy-8-phosphooctulonate synthase [Coxiella-like endosymbiont of Amblyomma americanum]